MTSWLSISILLKIKSKISLANTNMDLKNKSKPLKFFVNDKLILFVCLIYYFIIHSHKKT